MKYSVIERTSDAFQQSVNAGEIYQMCQRTFGEDCEVESAHELGGGLYNSVFLVKIAEARLVILRIAPALTCQHKSEVNLMRSEYASLPYFAPVAALLPRIIMADFTHHLIDRDFIFQSYIEGENWALINKDLTSEEKRGLWREVGELTRKIHTVKGDHFSYSFTGPTFSNWSAAVIARLEIIVSDLDSLLVKCEDLRKLLTIVRRHTPLLDEISRPYLLHGDLWLVNILVKRIEGIPQIAGIIDNDRASWGDPMADWTIFLLERNSAPEIQSFWETYGPPQTTRVSQFRQRVYFGCHCGAILLEQHRVHKGSGLERTFAELRGVVEELGNFSLD